MEARICRALALVACLCSLGASFRTHNFLVTAATDELSRDVAAAAEAYRRDLALEWLGQELPPWQDPCPITVHAGAQLGAGGATSFMFDRNRPFGWSMTIQGSRERILDSVLPHEITHTVFATHFGRPLPRWADEGACTTVEHDSERSKQKQLLVEFLTTGRGIAFNKMFAMTEYPSDVLPLYAQGYSLARYLIAQGGKQKFVAYVGDGMQGNDWIRATSEHYGFRNLSELQVSWLDWVRQGSPSLQPPAALVASNTPPAEPAAAAVAQLPHHELGSQSFVTASAASPAKEYLADANSGKGWYARVRDRHVEEASSPATPAREDRPGRLASRSAQPPTAEARSLSRPQPVGHPQQRILQWSSDASPPPSVPQSYLVPSGTIWR